MTPNRKPPYVRLRISMDSTVNALMELLPEIHDPVRKNNRYGARSKLIQDLVIRHLEERGVRIREAVSVQEQVDG